ncbi:hypothetical protein HNR10_002368 [Nocardiopsis aegyptia]|uniref:Uncharacterized protein n=1 Tax=Nocardiopsis aegyptia TaxID=220378 RepID=A0A7Z0JA75_9ACTN|nr:hypothetical protein [Nocardiopsis aegyptia]
MCCLPLYGCCPLALDVWESSRPLGSAVLSVHHTPCRPWTVDAPGSPTPVTNRRARLPGPGGARSGAPRGTLAGAAEARLPPDTLGVSRNRAPRTLVARVHQHARTRPPLRMPPGLETCPRHPSAFLPPPRALDPTHPAPPPAVCSSCLSARPPHPSGPASPARAPTRPVGPSTGTRPHPHPSPAPLPSRGFSAFPRWGSDFGRWPVRLWEDHAGGQLRLANWRGLCPHPAKHALGPRLGPRGS